MPPHIPLLGIYHRVYRIRSPPVIEISSFPRDDVRMQMRDALAGIGAILHCYVETRRVVDSLDHASDALDGQEEICYFRGCQVGESMDLTAGTDEDVTGEEGLDVDKGKRVRCYVEDLGRAIRRAAGKLGTFAHEPEK